MWVDISPDQPQNCFNITLQKKLCKGRHTWLKRFWPAFRAHPLNISIDTAHCQHLVCCIGRQREENQESSNILIHKEVDSNPREMNFQTQNGECDVGEHSPCKLKHTFFYLFTQVSEHIKLGFMWVKVPYYIHSFSWTLLVSSNCTVSVRMQDIARQISLSFPSFRLSEIIMWPEQRGGSGSGCTTTGMPGLNLLACISLFLHLFCRFSDTNNTHLYTIRALDVWFFTSLKPTVDHSYHWSDI